MNLHPASVKQDITLRAYRLTTLADIKTVILEDTHTGIQTNLLLNPEYKFTTQPGDASGRFILHFSEMANGISNMESPCISIVYANDVLNINGINQDYAGNTVFVSDMQGRLLLHQKIGSSPEMKIPLYLNTGTYIVKLTGGAQTIIKKILIQ
jgi:hypothetical protein